MDGLSPLPYSLTLSILQSFNPSVPGAIISLVAMSPSLLLFARTPERGKVKTRLVPPPSEPEALDLYRAVLEDASVIYRASGRWQSVLLAHPDPQRGSPTPPFPAPSAPCRSAPV